MPPKRSPTSQSVSRVHTLANVGHGEWLPLFDEVGGRLAGIRGRAGANGPSSAGDMIGADSIEMDPGSAFPLHVHPGDHILYVVSGVGFVHVDGKDLPVEAGDTIYLPSDLPHGVHTSPDAAGKLTFIAVGHPHRPLDSADRMRRVHPS